MLGPLVRVEMLTSARRLRHYLLRSGYATVLFLCLASIYSSFVRWSGTDDLSRMSTIGQTFFGTFTVVQLLAVLLFAPAYTSGAIALEKDRRTLELLLTSQLSAWEIVVGKYVSRLLQVLAVLACGMPILMWGTLFGGVSSWQVVAGFAVAAVTALVAGAVGICMSVWAKRTYQALVGTYAMLLLYLVVFPLVLVWTEHYLRWRGPVLEWWATVAHPFVLLASVIAFRGTGAPPVWQFAAGCTVLSVLLVALAVWRLRPVYIRQTYGTPKRVKRRRKRLPPVWANPVAWKETFSLRFGGVTRLGTFVYVLLFLPFAGSFVWEEWVRQSTYRETDEMLRFFTPIMVGLPLLLAGLQSAAQITGERDRQTLEVLLSTPLVASQIVWGKFLGMLRRMAWWFALPMVLLTTATVQGVLCTASLVCIIVSTGVYLCFAIALGLSLSTWCRTSGRARAATLATMILLGGGYMLCCIPVAISTSGRGGDTLAAVMFMPSPLIVLGFVTFPAEFLTTSAPDPEFPAATVIYVFGYAVAAAVLLWSTITRFDRRVRGEGARF